MTEPLLEVRNYHFSFPSYPGLESRPLFAGLNLELHAGDFHIILGAPEAGKTTLGV